MSVDDAHTLVRHALVGSDGDAGLHDLKLADLNDTEREHALTALRALHDLDAALGERSEFAAAVPPWEFDAADGGDA